MRLPSQPVTLTVEQIKDLNTKLATMRHDINNSLALIVGVADLLRRKPHMADNWLTTLAEQSPKIGKAIKGFSRP